jgi:hypothetical protein
MVLQSVHTVLDSDGRGIGEGRYVLESNGCGVRERRLWCDRVTVIMLPQQWHDRR